MDHLFRVNKKSNFKWKNPTSPYITDMYPESILTCDIIGDWDVSNGTVDDIYVEESCNSGQISWRIVISNMGLIRYIFIVYRFLFY